MQNFLQGNELDTSVRYLFLFGVVLAYIYPRVSLASPPSGDASYPSSSGDCHVTRPHHALPSPSLPSPPLRTHSPTFPLNVLISKRTHNTANSLHTKYPKTNVPHNTPSCPHYVRLPLFLVQLNSILNHLYFTYYNTESLTYFP